MEGQGRAQPGGEIMSIYALGAVVSFLIVVAGRLGHRKPLRTSDWMEILVFAFVLAIVWPIAAGCGLYRDVRYPWGNK
jgi:hypothetical protein